jgi:hypothetical protein
LPAGPLVINVFQAGLVMNVEEFLYALQFSISESPVYSLMQHSMWQDDIAYVVRYNAGPLDGEQDAGPAEHIS